MTPEQFCYWLQGRAEMQPDNPPSAGEWKVIADHLQLVFQKSVPARLAPTPLRDAYEASRLQGLVNSTLGRDIPQCGIGQTVQFGHNQPNIC